MERRIRRRQASGRRIFISVGTFFHDFHNFILFPLPFLLKTVSQLFNILPKFPKNQQSFVVHRVEKDYKRKHLFKVDSI